MDGGFLVFGEEEWLSSLKDGDRIEEIEEEVERKWKMINKWVIK